MAEGLTDDEVLAYRAILPSPAPERDPQKLRAGAIQKDIYGRHDIPPGTPADDAAAMILAKAINAGRIDDNLQSASGWANPEDRSAAREAYARKGKTPAEVKDRWDKSVYLMDPATSDYYQNHQRDADFLSHVASVPKDAPLPYHYGTGASGPQTAPKLGDALEYWDRSNGNPLWRDSWLQANYQNQSGAGNAALNAASNPDVPAGNYLNFSEVVPDFLRMQASGETGSAGESLKAAAGKRTALNRYRPLSPSMILDLPGGASPGDVRQRVLALRDELRQAELPNPDQRWKQWTKQNFGTEWAPPKVVSTGLDMIFSQADPTGLFPAAKALGAGAGAARAVAKGAKVASAVKNAAGPVAKEFVKDQAGEQVVGQTLVHMVGGPQDGKAKSPEEIAAANRARSAIHDRTVNDGAIKSADDAAFLRLQKDGLVSGFVR
jgi:hypothetical protein